MKRKEFIKMCGIFGISIPFLSSIESCKDDGITPSSFDGKVIIIGAGAGGLSAGYFLQQQGIDFEILEASSMFGGRIRINPDFADFPIALGAEWIETNTSIFQEIVNNASVSVNIETVPDAPDEKFVNFSWFQFFEEYIVPSIANKIVYNTIVQSVDYSNDQVIVNTPTGQFTADKVIVSVPLKILQDGDISFIPAFPEDKQEAINETIIWEGFKAFFEFSQNFYDDGHLFTVTPESAGQKLYYDATLGQSTSKHILGFFVVGTPAQDYISRSGNELKEFMLKELDGIFSNQASSSYIKHITQNWNNEPFIKSGYMTDYADWRRVQKLGASVANKIYFAGGPYTDGEDWVSVHAVARSAKRAIEEIV